MCKFVFSQRLPTPHETFVGKLVGRRKDGMKISFINFNFNFNLIGYYLNILVFIFESYIKKIASVRWGKCP